ncbi:MAG TPA: hypothetical protein PK141_15170 [Polyangiaceae bacterium]|nr:hypothetical protein [Polyangiaceae bacterium]
MKTHEASRLFSASPGRLGLLALVGGLLLATRCLRTVSGRT